MIVYPVLSDMVNGAGNTNFWIWLQTDLTLIKA